MQSARKVCWRSFDRHKCGIFGAYGRGVRRCTLCGKRRARRLALGTIPYSKKKNAFVSHGARTATLTKSMSTAAIGIRKKTAPRVTPDAIPRPPRMPSLGPRPPGAASGTRRVEIPAAAEGQFPPEEPSSFDTRRTPVVPACWPEQQDDEPRPTEAGPDIEIEAAPQSDTSAAAEPVAPAPQSDTSPASEPLAPAPQSDTSSASEPLAPAPQSDTSPASEAVAPAPQSDTSPASEPIASLGGGEVAFFEAPPQYSFTPPVLVSEAPRVRPSLLRSIVAKMLFVLITGATLILLCYEASVATHTPSLHPRRLLSAIIGG